MNDSPNGLKANGRQAAPENRTTRPRRSAAVVILLCFVAIVFDGYDLIVYGAIVPSLLAYEPWGLTPVQTGAYGSYALAGMFIGAIVVGYLTDVVGRRKVLLASISMFSLLMVATAFAPSPELFGLFRFLAGLGLGGVIPTAIAVTVEFSAAHRRNFNNALMFSGYAIGGILAALLAILLLGAIGFRGMLAIGCSSCCPSPRPTCAPAAAMTRQLALSTITACPPPLRTHPQRPPPPPVASTSSPKHRTGSGRSSPAAGRLPPSCSVSPAPSGPGR